MSKDVHVISENDLRSIKYSGRRIRSICPIHHGNERHLSVAAWSPEMDEEDERLAGWGHCHSANCGATVLVQEWNPQAAQHILGRSIDVKTPRHSITAEQREQGEDWQIDELAALNKLYPRMKAQLSHARAQAYLAGRGLQDMQELLTLLEVGYIPALSEWNGFISVLREGRQVKVDLRKWCDRIIFPYTTREGERGFIGRSLHLWHPGMDENEHKDKLKESEVLRWKKTYKGGYFNKEAMGKYKHLYLCEGTFDAIPLLYAGIENVVSMVGLEVDVKAIPVSVRTVTLAFDADVKNGNAVARACEKLGYAGIVFDFLPAPDDGKGGDWSERYRLHGREGLAPLLPSIEESPDELQEGNVTQPSESEPMEVESLVPFPCDGCGADGNLAPDEEYNFDPETGLVYCPSCWEKLQAPEPPVAQDAITYEQFLAVADQLAASILGGCVVHVDPPGYTLEDRVRDLLQEEKDKMSARIEQTRSRSRRGNAA